MSFSKKQRISFVTLLVIASARIVVIAAPLEVEETETTGRAKDRRTAIVNALVEAIDKVNGVRIDHKTVTYRRFRDCIDDIKINFDSTTVVENETRSVSNGLVQSYEVIQEGVDPDSHDVQVQLRVQVAVYDPKQSLMAGSRKVVAVAPFRVSASRNGAPNVDYPGNLSMSLCQGLVQSLVQSHKFTVLDREYLGELGGERNLIKSGDTRIKEQISIGQQLGADFLVVGDIQNVEVAPAIDQAGNPQPVAATVYYRIINVATGKDHWAGTYHRSYTPEELRVPTPARAGLGVDHMLMLDAADDISDEVISGVFPIRVQSIDGPAIVLNQGGVRTPVDSQLDVYKLGKAATDADTNESLDRIETWIARIRITRITSKLSYAMVIAGDAGKIDPATVICRRHVDFAAKYLAHPNEECAAVVLARAHNIADADMSRKLAEVLTGVGLNTDDTFFTTALIADGLFDRIFQSSGDDLRKLDLARHCKYVVLADKTENLVQHNELQGMINARGRLSVRVIRVSDGLCIDKYELSSDGVGFSHEKAIDDLNEKLSNKVGFGALLADDKSAGATPSN
jgi:hypothetical protein